MEIFQSWFNKCDSVEESVMAGYWDFAVHILTPVVLEHRKNPIDSNALEIGYGGGRLINDACSYFGHVIGIDIHEEKSFV